MPSTATASRIADIAARIAELEARLAEQLATAPDIPIRATLTADGLQVEPWSCDIIILDGTPIDARQSEADSLRMARAAFEQCGQLLLDTDRDCLPACLTKALVEHADDPMAAWVAATMRMQAGYPEHGVVIERSGDAAFYFPAVAKSIATLNVIGQHLRASGGRNGAQLQASQLDGHRAAELPVYMETAMQEWEKRVSGYLDAVAGAALKPQTDASDHDVAAASALPQAAELNGEKLARLISAVERTARQAAMDQAFRDGRGGDAEAEANEASQELHSFSGGEMVKRLIADRHIDASCAGDEALRKRVEDVMRRRLKWPKPSKRRPSSASAGAVAELAGKRQLSRPMALRADTSVVKWCRNCYFIPRKSGEEFCTGCLERHSASHLDEVLAGDAEAEGRKLPPEALEEARQQSLDRRRDADQHKLAAAARRR
jgi:hypothetical protein